MPGRSGSSPTPAELGEAGQQPVHEGAGALAGARVHHEAGGLVDHQQVRVLVHDRAPSTSGSPSRAARRDAVGHVDLELVAGPHRGRSGS